jgi:hypothetical protein
MMFFTLLVIGMTSDLWDTDDLVTDMTSDQWDVDDHVNVTPVASALKKINKTQLALTLNGVLKGFGLTEDVERVKDCINATETEVEYVHEAVELFRKKNAKDVMDGLGKLGSALDQLPLAINNCSIVAKEVKDAAPKLYAALEILKHPKDFVYHVGQRLIINHADIFHEISLAMESYSTQRWEEFGNYTGVALSELLSGKKAAPVHTLIV